MIKIHKILCLDDEELMTNALYLTLKDRYNVITSNSPLEALEIVRTQSDVDMVISDHSMPIMTGCEFLDRVRELNPHAHRMLISGFIKNVELEEYRRNGVVQTYVQKPWNLKEFVQTIGKILQ